MCYVYNCVEYNSITYYIRLYYIMRDPKIVAQGPC